MNTETAKTIALYRDRWNRYWANLRAAETTLERRDARRHMRSAAYQVITAKIAAFYARKG